MKRALPHSYQLTAHSRRWALKQPDSVISPTELDGLRLEQPDDGNLFYPMFKAARVPGYDVLRSAAGPVTFVLRGPDRSFRPQSAQAVLRHIFKVVNQAQTCHQTSIRPKPLF